MKQPKNDSKYVWTNHAWEKMQHYGISEQRAKRIVRFPKRTEGGVIDGAVAAMQPAGKQELWVMYVIESAKGKVQKTEEGDWTPASAGVTRFGGNIKRTKIGLLDNVQDFLGTSTKRFKIITVWRYPGVSPKRDPIPEEVLSEISSMI